MRKFVLPLVLMMLIGAGCVQQTGSPDSTTNTNSPSPNPTTNTNTDTNAANPSSLPTDPSKQSPDPGSGQSQGKQDGATMGKVTAVRLIDPASGWVGGSGWIARTDDAGKQWKIQYVGEQTVEQIFALNGQQAWVVFSHDPGDSNGRCLLHTTDGGAHWSPVGRMPNGGFLHFVSKQEAFAANAHTTDGGRTWEKLPVPNAIVGDAYFHDKNHGWAAAQENSRIVFKRTVDGGQTWKTVMSRSTASRLNGVVIRSAGADDAWIECIGDSGMSQTSYSLFHTSDGGKNWLTVIANSTAGAGPAPGYPMNDSSGPRNAGSKPGPLYVVSPQVAFMGGFCPACDYPNTVGWTTDGGKTWNNGKAQYMGYGGALLAIADAEHGWWICTDNSEPSVMYTTSDGGMHWKKAHTFDQPPK
ncbi:hypothetical protein [Ferviditalea candida]|uniref:Photosynthesis system II assembly factor Ycf48/Hcf136-like domain-containing protein n=1 Tax=Ferviditalea candida TaxID=3108399 RepID=A0ABU5ZHE9_9BACL|nr:hypothetical protein [Paenibacillaceae bacterium T2]